MGAGASTRNRVGFSDDGSSSSGSVQSLPRVVSNPSYTKLMKKVHDSIIGDGLVFNSLFGEKRVLYLDYTASGRPVTFIEDYIQTEVCHKYANTHTMTCVTARQTSLLREGARSYIKKCVNANDDDVLLFTGSGVTGAIHKLVSAMKIDPHKTVVLIGPYEHHSNILPWKESGATVYTIRQNQSGLMDLKDLESRLLECTDKSVIGSFSAASNVTGILSDVKRVTRLVKKYGGLVFWDYATAAPYVGIDMNSTSQGSIDAVFISPHKFIGGPQTPGILVAKKNLFTNKVPVIPGGGTVSYVYSDGHLYLNDVEAREEGGTPAIIESIRAALAFKIKHSIGLRQIEDRESYLYHTAKEYWTQNCKHMTILGCGSVHRLPIFSFIVTHPSVNKLIHHNFISTILNDLYGIQTRGGCACAGPYGEQLLGIDAEHFLKIFKSSSETGVDCVTCGSDHCDHDNQEILKPGFCRLNLPYTISEEELNFVLQAVKDVTENGWKLLPLYTYTKGGGWNPKNKGAGEPLNHLEDLVLTDRGLSYNSTTTPFSIKSLTSVYFQTRVHGAHLVDAAHILDTVPAMQQLTHKTQCLETLTQARQLMQNIPARLHDDADSDYHSISSDGGGGDNNLIWFVTPDEAEHVLDGENIQLTQNFIKRKSSSVPILNDMTEDQERAAFNPRAMTARLKQIRRHKLSDSLGDHRMHM